MFAGIYGEVSAKNGLSHSALIDLGFTFSPLVEQTSADTVVLNISGDELLFSDSESFENDWTHNIANAIAARASESGINVNVSIAANPDTAIHVARAFKGISIVSAGSELSQLGKLPIRLLDYSLAGIEEKRAEEIRETFGLWGIRTFGDLARLPLSGVAQRLGQEGAQLQKLARGTSDRQLILIQPPIGFEQSIELEHAITELEPLSFILGRLLNQLCANLHSHALATNELKLRLVTEPGTELTVETSGDLRLQTAARSHDPVTNARGADKATSRVGVNELDERTISLPVPMRNPKTLLRLLLFDIEAQPPQAPIISIEIAAEPVKPRTSQTGLFVPLAPEPEKLEIILARLAKLVGPDNVGSPELLDTHRPDAFRMKRFTVSLGSQKSRRGARRAVTTLRSKQANSEVNRQSAISKQSCVMGFRLFRPSWRAEVQTYRGEPVRIAARNADASAKVRGKIVCASGPWRASGDWWRADVWARDEWDVAVADPHGSEDQVLCRIYRNLASEEWYVEGIYD